MKKINLLYLIFTFIIAIPVIYQGCSETEDNLVNSPELLTHPDGWADTASQNFHGKYIFDNKQWNLKSCRSCHGGDYAGGTSGSTCLTCHSASGGPQNCRLCHGGLPGRSSPPKALNGETSEAYIGVGMHVSHMDSTNYSKPVVCSECHKSLTEGFDSPDHIGDNPDGIAEVTFGVLAKTETFYEGGSFMPNPVWNREAVSCSESYCHGTFKDGNLIASPVWTDKQSVKCGSCHGDPVSGNPNPIPNGNFFHPHYPEYTINICYQCHGGVINNAGVITAPDLHLNGVVNFND